MKSPHIDDGAVGLINALVKSSTRRPEKYGLAGCEDDVKSLTSKPVLAETLQAAVLARQEALEDVLKG
jgi:hypothetical protein